MSQKIKSSLFFASFVIALIAYSHISDSDSVQNTQLAENTMSHVSTDKALN